MERVIAASILFGAVAGAYVGSGLSERLGRRRTVPVVSAVFVGGSLACAVAPTPRWCEGPGSSWGFAVGGATSTVPMYVAGLAPASKHGRLVLTLQSAPEQASSSPPSSARPRWCRGGCRGGSALPAVLMGLLTSRLPESPRWLVEADRRDDARTALAGAREEGSDLDTPSSRTSSPLEERERDAGTGNRGWRRLREPWLRPVLGADCGVAVVTGFSGIEKIIYYAPTIVTDNGFPTTAALRVSVARASPTW